MGYIGGTTNKTGMAVEIPSFATDQASGNLIIYVQNVGQGTVQLDPAGAVYVNNALVAINTWNGNPVSGLIPIAVGQTVALVVNSPYSGAQVSIKVVTTSGTFMQITGTDSSSGGSATLTSTTLSPPTLNPSTITLGASVTASGSLMAGSTGVSGETVTITYHVSGQVDVSHTQITSGSGGYSDSYSPNIVGSWSVTASFAGDTTYATSSSTAQSLTVGNVQASKLAFSAGAGQTLSVGQVSSTAIVVQRQDSSGNPVSTGTSAITVTLASSSSGGTFYSDSAGTQAITQITIAAGSSNSAGFYYKDTVTGNPTLTASYSGLTSATTQFTISAAAASKLVFTAGTSQSLTAGVVSPTAIVVQRQDASGNPVSSGTSAITVSLSTTSSGGKFYSDSGGTTVITQITIAAGSSSSAGFYYKDTVAASPTLTGAYSGLTSATTQFTIGAAGASKLVFTVAPTTVTHRTVSSVFTVQVQDQYGNPTTTGITVNLSDNAGGNGIFYSDSGGNHQITSVTIASGSSTANFYWEYNSWNNLGSKTITASATGLTSATTSITVN
jgi:hypothetical protein